MILAIRAELYRSRSFMFSVAFVNPSAVAMLKQAFLDFPGPGKIITSTYLGFNSPEAFWELLNLPRVDVHVYDDPLQGFHSKGYIFKQESTATAIIGSSNLTDSALASNQEWNLRLSALPDGDVVEQLERAVQDQLGKSHPLTAEWIQKYEDHWRRPEDRQQIVKFSSADTCIQPNAMQQRALTEIAAVRESGEKRAIVVSATGTGKTILAALAVREVNPERMLFIVHREQILDRAIEEFQRVLNVPANCFGKFAGTEKQLDRKYVFATDRSLASPDALAGIDPQEFDYVLIDEAYRAGAAGYQLIIDHLRPRFLLGLTATPERTDDFNVYELFYFNVPFEIRLQEALEENMLSPFHYYGVRDYECDGQVIEDFTDLSKLISPGRVKHIISTLETYGHAGISVRGLMFSSRKEEAVELSQLLNQQDAKGKRLRTIALTCDDSVASRESAVDRLERGELDYIVTVDLFNEGVDIPTVNQVVMLRQTNSSIFFRNNWVEGCARRPVKII